MSGETTKAPFPWSHCFWSLCAGVVLTIAVGFGSGEWTLSSTAKQMAQNTADTAVAAALTPTCVTNFKKAPDYPVELAKLKKTDQWDRESFIEKGGWDKVNGKTYPGVANACAGTLVPS